MLEDLIAIKGKLRLYKAMRQTKISFGLSKRLGQNVGEEKKGEKKRKKKEKEKKTKPRYVVVLKSWVFWIPKVLIWRLFLIF